MSASAANCCTTRSSTSGPRCATRRGLLALIADPDAREPLARRERAASASPSSAGGAIPDHAGGDRERLRMQALLTQMAAARTAARAFRGRALGARRTIARHAGLEFSVRIDRVDRLADGARVLIDYKSGMAAPDWRGERPDNPQLPIYALLRRDALVAVAYGRVNAADCSFVAEAERAGLFKRGQRDHQDGRDADARGVDRGLVAAHREARRGLRGGPRRRGSDRRRRAGRATCTACAASPRRSMTAGTAMTEGPPPMKRRWRARAGDRRGRLGSGAGAGRQRQDHVAHATLSAAAGLGRCAGAHSGAHLHAPRRAGNARAGARGACTPRAPSAARAD